MRCISTSSTAKELIKFFRSQFFGFPQCFCAVARKSLGLQDVFWAKTSCWSGVCAAPAGGRIPRENAISGMISRISAKGGKREISDVGRWRAPAAAANEDNSDEWPSATTAAILCAATTAPPPGTWSASQASSAPPRSCQATGRAPPAPPRRQRRPPEVWSPTMFFRRSHGRSRMFSRHSQKIY